MNLSTESPYLPANRDLAFYYGDLSFFPHIARLFLVKRIDVTITFLDRVKTDGDRKELVDYCHGAISDVFEKKIIPENSFHKQLCTN